MTSGFQWRTDRVPKTAAEQYRLRRLRREQQVSRQAAFPLSVEVIADRDRLFESFQELKAKKIDTAGGIDGVRFAALSTFEFTGMLPELSKDLIDGSYRPQPFRYHEIPKANSKMLRRLAIAVILDRVVANVVLTALTPYWERLFLNCSWGFRPRRSAWGMLVELERTIKAGRAYVLAIDDIKTAFDMVPIEETLQCHRTMLDGIERNDSQTTPGDIQREKDRLIELIRLLLCGSDLCRQRGIPQGGNYSPTALNALLHFHLDEPMTKLTGRHWFRYADNVCVVTKSLSAGQQVLGSIRQMLQPLGLALKGADGVHDLRKADAQLLGFRIAWGQGRLVYGLGDQAIANLRQSLQGACKTQDSPETARTVLKGWIQSMGPACADDGVNASGILDDTAQQGFREIASREVGRWIRSSAEGWRQFCPRG